ncbi:hypothetical protein AAC387_Pa08g1104 [Persea americana]
MEDDVLHVAMVPWLAFGHMGPYLELAKALAKRGHHISFISTRRNIERLPKIPLHLSPHIDLVGLPLPHTVGLPDSAESTMDVTPDQMYCLKNAFDGLEGPVATFLESAAPDWIIYDVISYWVPRIAAKLGLPCAHFNTFPAVVHGVLGPPSEWVGVGVEGGRFKDLEGLISVPPWVRFHTNVVIRSFEAIPLLQYVRHLPTGGTDIHRFETALRDCPIILLRDCMEFSSDWLRLMEDLYQKPVLPIGFLPPSIEEANSSRDETYPYREWLDKKTHGSTVYVAFGTEVSLSKEQLHQLALGLEQSQLPFIWALRTGADDPEMLPLGFEDRIKGQGIVHKGWVPQLKILAHPSIGGFLTHGGWSSLIEALGLGRTLVLLTLTCDQGVTARLIEEKWLGLEVPRDEIDGSFTGADVAKTLRKVMVEADGEIYRAKAMKMKDVFGNELSDQYIDSFARYLKGNKSGNRLLSSSA